MNEELKLGENAVITHKEAAELLDISRYREAKNRPSRTLNNFKKLVDALNKTKREEATYALVAFIYSSETYVEVSYFKTKEDAFYTARYLKGIVKREYKGFRISATALKDINLAE